MSLSEILRFLSRPSHSAEPVSGARARRTVVVTVAILAAALAPLLWKPWIHGTDGVRNYVYIRSLLLDGDLDFSNEFAHYRATGDYQIVASPDAVAAARPGNSLGVGSSLLWSPFFLAGHLVAKIGSESADGYGAPYAWAISFASTLYATIGLLLLTRLLCWRFSPLAALVAILSVWFGAPLAFYMYLHPSMSHSCSFFLCALIVWQYERWRDAQELRHFLLIGLTCGLAVATRFNNGVFLLLPAAFWLRACMVTPHVRKTDRDARWLVAALGLTLLGCAIGFLPQAAAWRAVYGSWFAGPRGYDLGNNLLLWKSPNILHVLLSGWRGLFIWTPALIFSVWGFVLLLSRRRLLDLTLAVMFLIQLWIIGGWHMWWGGASFGQRFFINFTPAFALGLAWLFTCLRPGAPRKTLATTLLLCVVWTTGLAAQYIGGVISRERPVSISELFSNQFREVPWVALEHLKFLRPDRRLEDNPHAPPVDSP